MVSGGHTKFQHNTKTDTKNSMLHSANNTQIFSMASNSIRYVLHIILQEILSSFQ